MKKTTKIAIGTVALTLCISTTSFAENHIVKKGDTFWKVSQKYRISIESILKENKANKETIIYPGQVIKIPERQIKKNSVNRGAVDIRAIKNTIEIQNEEVKEKEVQEEVIKKDEVIQETSVKETTYGEYLNWFNEVDKIVPRGAEFKVIDFYTGKSYMVQRSVGSNHADCETLTKEDTDIMKSIWGGFSWARRPAIVEYNGRKIAASVTFMPHAGLDSVAGGAMTNNRSGGYGRGINFDYIKGNGIDGHFDIHFAGSTRHMDGKQDTEHQKMIKIAAGIK
ncbi:LysM domain-containing protein [Tissierella sp.]|uniref:LysM peptidoglycan-binding domain-containing protein n=1 Tax=Tissierella sp. TaxID=41274 RepID=UPI0028AF74F9|nr:LysM domain-containing protein [Tissierella sp.]